MSAKVSDHAVLLANAGSAAVSHEKASSAGHSRRVSRKVNPALTESTVLCGLTPTTPLRKACIYIYQTKAFRHTVIFLILVNCIFLMQTEPFGSCCESIEASRLAEYQITDVQNFSLFCNSDNILEVENVATTQKCCINQTMILSDARYRHLRCASDGFKLTQALVDRILNSLFTVEMLIKIVALGFVRHKGSYLRDPWNVLDFIVVVVGWLSELPQFGNVSALRTFRIFRPLRTLSSLQGMRPVVKAIFASLPALGKVMVLTSFLFVLFGVLGFQLFSGTLTGRCHYVDPLGSGDFNSHGSVWNGLSQFRLNTEDEVPCPLPCAQEVDGNPNVESWPWSRINYAGCIPLAGKTCRGRGGLILNNPFYTGSYNETIVQEVVLPSDGPWNPASRIWANLAMTEMLSSFEVMNTSHGTFRQTFNSTDPYIEVQTFCLDTRQNQLGKGYATFDTFGYSVLTIFTSITLEGWVDVMYGVEATFGRDTLVFLYFASMVFICAMFMLELILAVISDEYDSAAEEEESILAREAEQEALEQVDAGPDSDSRRYSKRSSLRSIQLGPRPYGPYFFRQVFRLVTSRYFESAITVLIVLNTVSLAVETHPVTVPVATLESINFFFTIAFFAEMVLKLVGLGVVQYAKDKFNLFDFVIVWISIVELIVEQTSASCNNSNGNATEVCMEGGASGLSALRTFRLLRVFKLARSWKNLRELMNTILLGLQDCVNALLLLVLIMMIFTLLGMQFFGGRWTAAKFCEDPSDYDACKAFTPRPNFDTFWNGFVTVFQILTGENWNEVMYTGLVAMDGSGSVVVYFVVLNVVGNYIVLNLFLAILLARFDSPDEDEDEAQSDVPRPLPSHSVAPMPEGGDSLQPSESDKTTKDVTTSRVLLPTNDPNKIEVHPTAKAFGVLGHEHPIRKSALSLVTSKRFDNFVLFLILLSTLFLIIDEPWIHRCFLLGWPSTNECANAQLTHDFLHYADFVLNTLFTLEMLVKMIALGVIGHRHAYLRNPWNQLDFIIVIISWVSLSQDGAGAMKALRSLRAFRALRPLRVVSRFPGMKLVVNSLFLAMPAILNVTLVCMLFFLILAITGVQNFKGMLNSCNDPNIGLATKGVCLGEPYWVPIGDQCEVLPSAELVNSCRKNGTGGCQSCLNGHGFPRMWEPAPTNFDNVFQALLVVFEVSTGEMWPDIMYLTQDGQGVDEPMHEWPHQFNSLVPVWFMAVTLVCSFIMLNIFVGVIIDNFNHMKEQQNGSGLLTEEQKLWVETMKESMNTKPLKKLTPPTNPKRLALWDFVMGKEFDSAIMLLILLNTISMCISTDTKEVVEILDTVDLVFLILFTVEMVLKLLAMDIKYFKSNWNRFDCFLVVIGWVGISGAIGPVASLLRLLRIARIFRLVRTSKTLITLFRTFMCSLPQIVNVGMICILLLMIFAIISMNLFANIKFGSFLNEDANFQSFFGAMKTLFRMATGESFNGIMHDCIIQPPYCDREGLLDNCGYRYTAPLLFCVFYVVTAFMLLSMITAIVLDNFGEQDRQAENVVTPEHMQNFRETWAELFNGEIIDIESLPKLLKRVDHPLGVRNAKSNVSENKLAKKLIQKLDIPSVDGRVMFTDVLSELVKEAMSGIELPEENAFVSTINDRKNAVQVKSLKRMGSATEGLLFNAAQVQAAIILQSAMAGYIYRRKMEGITKSLSSPSTAEHSVRPSDLTPDVTDAAVAHDHNGHAGDEVESIVETQKKDDTEQND